MNHETVNNRKVIVFQLNNEAYAIPVTQVGSIERIMPITRVPQTTDFVKGVINLRGIVTPVIDLRIRFDLEEISYTDTSRIIIVYQDDIQVGLIVDAANDVTDIPADAVEGTPEVVGAADIDYIDGVAKISDRLLILLNLKRVLATEELKKFKVTES